MVLSKKNFFFLFCKLLTTISIVLTLKWIYDFNVTAIEIVVGSLLNWLILKETVENLSLSLCIEDQILKTLKKFEPKCTTDPDDFPAFLLKYCALL